MNKRLSVEGPLSVDELEGRYRQARAGVERSQWQIVWLAARGHTCQEVAAQTGYSVGWVRELIHRYNRQGAGRPRRPAAGQSGPERTAVPGAAGGVGAGPGGAEPGWRAVEWAAGGRVDEPAGGPARLATARVGLSAAAGIHPASAAAAARQSRPGGPRRLQGGALEAAIETIRQVHPTDVIELWGSDEHRVGLKPIRRWVWARRGQRVVAAVQPRYQWTYLYGFVRPSSGQTWWLLLPTVRADLFTVALAQFAQAVGAGQGKQVLVLLDRAGWHLSGQVQVPEGVHLVWLPPYSPELQPAERLWPLADEPLVNQSFPTLDDVEAVLAQRCATLQSQPTRIQALTRFHWWPKTA